MSLKLERYRPGKFALFTVSVMSVNVLLILKYAFPEDENNSLCHLIIVAVAGVLIAIGLFNVYILRQLEKVASDTLPSLKFPKLSDQTFNEAGVFMTMLSLLLLSFDSWQSILLFLGVYGLIFMLMSNSVEYMLNATFGILGYRLYHVDEDFTTAGLAIPKDSFVLMDKNERRNNIQGTRFLKLTNRIYYAIR